MIKWIRTSRLSINNSLSKPHTRQIESYSQLYRCTVVQLVMLVHPEPCTSTKTLRGVQGQRRGAIRLVNPELYTPTCPILLLLFFSFAVLVRETVNPKPYTSNAQRQTPNLKPQTLVRCCLLYTSSQIGSESPFRCRANMAHIRQSGPDYGLGFQVKALTNFKLIPLRLATDFETHPDEYSFTYSLPWRIDDFPSKTTSERRRNSLKVLWTFF